MPSNSSKDRADTLSNPPSRRVERRSSKNRILALVLCFFFGVFGVHRFYVGKFWTGLLLFVTGGGFGLWWMIDLALIALGRFKDSENRVLGPPKEDRKRIKPSTGTDGSLASDRSESTPEETYRVETDDGDEIELDGDEVMKDPVEEEFEKLEREYEVEQKD